MSQGDNEFKPQSPAVTREPSKSYFFILNLKSLNFNCNNSFS